MAGGRGERLKQLTEDRCKPATPFGGKFRIIDFVLSNCLNSGIRQISVLTQYKAHSLIQHIGRGWGFLRGEFGEFIEIIPGAAAPRARVVPGHRGRAVAEHGTDPRAPPAARARARRRSHLQDGLRPDDRLPRREGSGHHRRRRRGAARPRARVRRADGRRVESRAALPGEAAAIRSRCRAGPTSRSRRWASTSSTRGCSSACCAPTPRIPAPRTTSARTSFRRRSRTCACSPIRSRTCARKAQNYWRDVGTVDAYYEANMELVRVSPELNIYDEQWPIWTYQEQLPPAKFVFDDEDRRGCAIDSMVSGGCIISGSRVSNSLLFSQRARARLLDGRSLGDPAARAHRRALRDPQRDHRRGRGGAGRHDDRRRPGADRERFYVSENGVTLVTASMLRAPARGGLTAAGPHRTRTFARDIDDAAAKCAVADAPACCAVLVALAGCSTFEPETRVAGAEPRRHPDAVHGHVRAEVQGARAGQEPERPRDSGPRASTTRSS